MVNFNGNLISDIQTVSDNRGFKYGDAVFETIKYIPNQILFWEDHYFRLMSSMRIIRMEIPMTFTMEFLEGEIIKLIEASKLENEAVRVRINVFRDSKGLYTPEQNNVYYYIEVKALDETLFNVNQGQYVVDLFKDHYITPQLLSTLKTNNRVLNVIAGIYAKENDLNNCILINSNKSIVEAINGNLFLRKGNTVKTPPLTDGCIKGIMRKQLIDLIRELGYVLLEESISPFEIQKSDELFFTNVIKGITSVSKYRKKDFVNDMAVELTENLNKKIQAN